jgi:stage V sporulation protein AE
LFTDNKQKGLVIMEFAIDLLKSFAVGGIICLIGQILIDTTKLTPGRILVAFVVAGVVLKAVGVYEPLVEFAGCGATVPLSGFGYAIANGVKTEVLEKGLLGALTGGIGATAGGITASICFGLLASFIFSLFISGI